MEEYIGTIMSFGFNFPPKGWAFCDGQLLSIASNQTLYALLGTTFGGDGRTTFGLPDLKGRTMVHVGHGSDLQPVNWGQKAGTEVITLTKNNLPQHSHYLIEGFSRIFTNTVINTGPGPVINEADNGEFPFASGGRMKDMFAEAPAGFDMVGGVISHSEISGNTSEAGYNSPMNVRDPYVGIYVSICMYGIFPPRG